ncbi:hypothetical protein BJ742DRAFT_738908 [Cladochytrium replicatum]|nr:hypothetical protein BJ742DRAFT_738908 [Cladochytrium replicatum]
MLTHYTTLNDHKEWRWRVYRLKQRGVMEQACKLIAMLRGMRDNYLDSKTDLVFARGDAPVTASSGSNTSAEIQKAHQGTTGNSHTARIDDAGNRMTTAVIPATTEAAGLPYLPYLVEQGSLQRGSAVDVQERCL